MGAYSLNSEDVKRATNEGKLFEFCRGLQRKESMNCKGASVAGSERRSLATDERTQTVHSCMVSRSIPTLLQICLCQILVLRETNLAGAAMSVTSTKPRNDTPVAEIINDQTTQDPSGKRNTRILMNLLETKHVVRYLAVHNVHTVQPQHTDKICASLTETIRSRIVSDAGLAQRQNPYDMTC